MAVFKVTGLNEVRRAYRELPRRVAGKVVRGAIRQALKPVKAEVEKLAPRGETKLLAKSVKIRARPKVRRGVIAIDVRIGEGDFKGVTFYAAFVDLGTKLQPPQGFIERAFEATKDSAAEEVRTLIVVGIIRELS